MPQKAGFIIVNGNTHYLNFKIAFTTYKHASGIPMSISKSSLKGVSMIQLSGKMLKEGDFSEFYTFRAN
jgi:hypothetical protein